MHFTVNPGRTIQTHDGMFTPGKVLELSAKEGKELCGEDRLLREATADEVKKYKAEKAGEAVAPAPAVEGSAEGAAEE